MKSGETRLAQAGQFHEREVRADLLVEDVRRHADRPAAAHEPVSVAAVDGDHASGARVRVDHAGRVGRVVEQAGDPVVVGVEVPRHAQMRAIWPPNAVKLGLSPRVALPWRRRAELADRRGAGGCCAGVVDDGHLVGGRVVVDRGHPQHADPGSPIVAALVAVAVVVPYSVADAAPLALWLKFPSRATRSRARPGPTIAVPRPTWNATTTHQFSVGRKFMNASPTAPTCTVPPARSYALVRSRPSARPSSHTNSPSVYAAPITSSSGSLPARRSPGRRTARRWAGRCSATRSPTRRGSPGRRCGRCVERDVLLVDRVQLLVQAEVEVAEARV